MKIAGHTFKIEEVLLCLAMAVFFTVILIGSWQFSAESALFPMMLSVPALILVALYAFQGVLPAAVRQAISSSDRFAIGKKPEGVVSEGGDENVARVYFVFAFTAAFAVLAWAVGFYLAALLSIATYLTKTRSEISQLTVVAMILAVLALGMIYLFDTAFGHHYGRGAWLSFL
ncbi:hypothetical protein [Aliiroseovarius sediminis]|uniref:hypothetical protein n=1 Tax=Aliiroseovarius sediminis TaxID=2925839 RepID=UPI001F5909FE|nr:hypothetical protein [Aliiroseovarius sediminis]MCI2395025.1 hypothetical protein [Aliiroseovarius sediminis]